MIAAEMQLAATHPTTTKRAVVGWFCPSAGFLACPCHRIITLPRILALHRGTDVGSWSATHT